MIRTGIDVVDIARFGAALESWPRLAERLFTDGERSYAATRLRPVESLAARFAAKEATFKALGEGWPALSWHQVEVVAGNGPAKGRPRRPRAVHIRPRILAATLAAIETRGGWNTGAARAAAQNKRTPLVMRRQKVAALG